MRFLRFVPILMFLAGCYESGVTLSLEAAGKPTRDGEPALSVEYACSADGSCSARTADLLLQWSVQLYPSVAEQRRGELTLSIANTGNAPIQVHWADARIEKNGEPMRLYVTIPGRREDITPPQRDATVSREQTGGWTLGVGPPGEPGDARGTGPYSHYEAWLPVEGRLFQHPGSSATRELEAAGGRAIGTRLTLILPLTIGDTRNEYGFPAVVESAAPYRKPVGF